jgi:hypothetical protein
LYIGLAGGILIVLSDDLSLLLLGLLAEYAAAAWFTAPALGSGVAIIKVVGGAITIIILWVSLSALTSRPSGPMALAERLTFRLAALTLIVIAAWGIARAGWLESMIPSAQARIVSLQFLGMGLLLMGLFLRPLKVSLGLLTFLSGFEILYSTLEPSLAVVALLLMIHIGIAMATGYISLREGSIRQGEAQDP